MKNSKYKIILTSIIGLFLIATFIAGCGFGENGKTTWFIDPNNHFHTNDVKRAQREIPFTIILPSYMPENFGSKYGFQIDGLYDDSYEPHFRGVRIEITDYGEEESRIYISEINTMPLQIMGPTDELDPIYLDIAGTRVLRQKTGMVGSSGITEGLGFHWNQDGLTFDVRVFSISEEEGLKIVESMVKQMNQ